MASELQKREDMFKHIGPRTATARRRPTLLGPRSDWEEEEKRAEARWDRQRNVRVCVPEEALPVNSVFSLHRCSKRFVAGRHFPVCTRIMLRARA